MRERAGDQLLAAKLAFVDARIMNDPGIKKQVKAHWKRLQ